MRLLPFVLLLFFSVAPAAAQSCSFTISSVNFGTINVLSGSHADTTASFQYSCSNGSSNGTIRICPNIAEGSGGATETLRFMTGGAGTLQFQLYRNSARTTIWGSHFWSFSPVPPTIDLDLNWNGSGSGSTTIYARVFGGQNTVPAGSYASSFTSSHVDVRYRDGTNRSCGTSNFGWSSAHPTFTATATVADMCDVSATNVDFGTEGVLDTAVDATGAVSTTCTVGTAYTIGLNGGLSNAPPDARLMTKGAESITYGLFKDAARSEVWGDSDLPGSMVSGVGNGSSVNDTVYGRVPTQATPSAGTYSDTVVVTVTY